MSRYQRGGKVMSRGTRSVVRGLMIVIFLFCFSLTGWAGMEHGMMGHGKGESCCPDMERIKAHWEEMERLAQQLRDHTQAIKGLSDQGRLLSEILRHQEMIDEFIGKIIELQQMRREMMREHHQRMRQGDQMKGRE